LQFARIFTKLPRPGNSEVAFALCGFRVNLPLLLPANYSNVEAISLSEDTTHPQGHIKRNFRPNFTPEPALRRGQAPRSEAWPLTSNDPYHQYTI